MGVLSMGGPLAERRKVLADAEAADLTERGPDEVGQRGMTALLYMHEDAGNVMPDEHAGDVRAPLARRRAR